MCSALAPVLCLISKLGVSELSQATATTGLTSFHFLPTSQQNIDPTQPAANLQSHLSLPSTLTPQSPSAGQKVNQLIFLHSLVSDHLCFNVTRFFHLPLPLKILQTTIWKHFLPSIASTSLLSLFPLHCVFLLVPHLICVRVLYLLILNFVSLNSISKHKSEPILQIIQVSNLFFFCVLFFILPPSTHQHLSLSSFSFPLLL